MSINLLDLAKSQISGQLAKQASSFLGESEYSVVSALGSMMPALLGSAIQKTTTTTGSQNLMDLISKLDLNSLSDIAGIFGGGASSVNGLLNSGGGIIDSLLGNKTSGLVDMISGLSGLKSGSTSSLLKLAAPFLLGLIGKQVQGKGLSGLTDLLGSQKSLVSAALPSGLSALMNFSGFDSNVKSSLGSTSSSTGGNRWMKWLLPLLLAVIAILWFANKGCGKKVVDMTDSAITAIDSTATKAVDATMAVTDSISSAIGNLFSYKLTSGFELVGAAKDGIESQLVTFIEDNTKVVDKDTWFNFDRLLFDTGKETLQPQSQEQLVNIAEILKAFPKVKIKIGGYTDNTGDPKFNQKLSTDRAYNVMNQLVALGVAKERLSAEGYGDKFPVADNSTEEGRQLNRRIAVRVSEK